VAAEPDSRRGVAPTTVRDDPTGELRRSLEALIAWGRVLERGLEALGHPGDPGPTGGELERWKLECLQALRAGFEPESATEFLAAATRPGPRADGDSALPLRRRRMRDALELLLALNGTLGGHGRPRAGGLEARRARTGR